MSDVEPAVVRRLGDAIRVYPRGEFCHARRNQIQLEAEKRIPLTGASHLPGDRQIHCEHEHARGVVFEHFTAKHHDLGPLRHDAQRRPQRRVDGLGRDPRTAQRIGPGQPKRKHAIVRSVARNEIGQASQRQRGRSRQADDIKRHARRGGIMSKYYNSPGLPGLPKPARQTGRTQFNS